MTRLLKALLAASFAAALAACGGGSGDASTGTAAGTNTADVPALVQPAWASPAMFVPVGASSATIQLSSCTVELGTPDRAELAQLRETPAAAPTTSPIYSATLTITAAGDAVFSGATSSTGTVAELVRVNLADTFERSVQDSTDPDVEPSMLLETDDSLPNVRKILLMSNGGVGNAQFVNGDTYYECTLAPGALRMGFPPSEARLAATFLAGLTSTSTITAGTSILAGTDGTAYFWGNQRVNTTLPANQRAAQYAGLDRTTGNLTVSANYKPDNPAAVQTRVALLLPSTGTGVYTEQYVKGIEGAEDGLTVKFVADTTDNGRLAFQVDRSGVHLIATPQLGTSIVFLPPALPMAY